jgi:hypothetical protein
MSTLRLSSLRKTPIGTLMMTEALLGGMKEGGRKATNMSETSEFLQEPDESPSQFYEHLCEAFHL